MKCEFPGCGRMGERCPVCKRTFCKFHSPWHYHTMDEIRAKFR